MRQGRVRACSDYVDLLLLRRPSHVVPLEHTDARALRELQEQGRIRHPGVSNFPTGMLARALSVTRLLADEVEYHPFLDQDALLDMVVERDITLTAYSPLARGRVVRNRTLAEIGDRTARARVRSRCGG